MDWTQFDSMNDRFEAKHLFRDRVETLPDGSYDIDIIDASDGDIKGAPVFRLGLQCNGGMVVEHIYWVESDDAVNAFGADMKVLGMPAERWGNTIPLSKALPEALKACVGMRFRGMKSTDKGTGKNEGKTFPRLRFVCKLDKTGGSRPTAPAASSSPAPAMKSAVASENIPF
jgi:hypothetical protein